MTLTELESILDGIFGADIKKRLSNALIYELSDNTALVANFFNVIQFVKYDGELWGVLELEDALDELPETAKEAVIFNIPFFEECYSENFRLEEEEE